MGQLHSVDSRIAVVPFAAESLSFAAFTVEAQPGFTTLHDGALFREIMTNTLALSKNHASQDPTWHAC